MLVACNFESEPESGKQATEYAAGAKVTVAVGAGIAAIAVAVAVLVSYDVGPSFVHAAALLEVPSFQKRSGIESDRVDVEIPYYRYLVAVVANGAIGRWMDIQTRCSTHNSSVECRIAAPGELVAAMLDR